MKQAFSILILLSILSPLALRAQVGSPRTDLSVGFSGGYVMNKVSFNPTIKQAMKPGMTVGFTARYICERYFGMICGFQTELNYVQAGWKEDITTSSDTYQRTVHYLQVPLFAHLGFGRERKGVKGFLVAGPQLGFCIGESESRGGEWSEETLSQRLNGVTAQYDLPVEKKFEYGIGGGLGLEVNIKGGHHLLMEGRYFYALSDMFGNTKKDPFGRSANGTITAKVSYLFDVVKTPNFVEKKRKKKDKEKKNRFIEVCD